MSRLCFISIVVLSLETSGSICPAQVGVGLVDGSPPRGVTGAMITGQVTNGVGSPISNVTITLSGGQNSSTQTDSAGRYRFLNLALGAGYTITPSRVGMVFYPPAFTIQSLPSNVSAPFYNSPPPGPQISVNSVAPLSGSGSRQTFSISVSDVNGYSDLNTIELVFTDPGGNPNIDNRCKVRYDAGPNYLWVFNEATGFWSGPVFAGGWGLASNNYCSVIGWLSSTQGLGTAMTLNVATDFKSTLAGAKSVNVRATGTLACPTAWTVPATWTVAAPYNAAPVTQSVTPSSGSGTTQIFEFRFSDASGAQDIAYAHLLFGTSSSFANNCLVQYSLAGNSIFLMDNGGANFLAPIPINSTQMVFNNQCKIRAQNSTFTQQGTLLTLRLDVEFMAGYSGTKPIIVQVGDYLMQGTGWEPGEAGRSARLRRVRSRSR